MSAMKTATPPRARRRRPAPPPPEAFKDLTPFEQIATVCCAPAALLLRHVDEMAPYRTHAIDYFIEDELFLLALAGGAVGLCAATVLWCLLKGVALALRRIQRPKYYPQERLRRQALARERRRIRRRTTLNAAPTADAILAQWAKVRQSPEEMIRFGSLLCDLEAYVDNSLVRNEYGEIVGRNPGIRGWLNAHCPPLAARYKTVMGYKALAEKFRQAVGLADPYPATLALGDPAAASEAIGGAGEDDCQNTERKSSGAAADDVGGKAEDDRQNMVRTDGSGSVGAAADSRADAGEAGRKNMVRTDEVARTVGRQNTVRKDEARRAARKVQKRAKRRAEEMLGACGRSQRGVRLVLAARLAPDQVPPEVEMEERRRQGLPARDGIVRRFVERMA